MKKKLTDLINYGWIVKFYQSKPVKVLALENKSGHTYCFYGDDTSKLVDAAYQYKTLL